MIDDGIFPVLRSIIADLGALAVLACEHSPAHLADEHGWTCRGCDLLADRIWAVLDLDRDIEAAVDAYLIAAERLLVDAADIAPHRTDAPWPELRAVALAGWHEVCGLEGD